MPAAAARSAGWKAALSLIALAGVSCAAARPARYPVDPARLHARVVKQVEMGPRIPGTPGHDAIVRWLESELKRMGATVEEQTFLDTLPSGPLTTVCASGGPDDAADLGGWHRVFPLASIGAFE